MLEIRSSIHSFSFSLLGCLFLLLLGCSPERPPFNAIDISGADYAQSFTLTDQNGSKRSLSDFKGKVVVLFFGYTQCPDVCPTSLSELVKVKQLLGKQGDLLQGIFVTVDPQRDTSEMLKAYMANFDDSFVAFVPTPVELEDVAKKFKIYYKKVDGKTPTSYTMDHSAGSYVYDASGRLRLFSRYGLGAEKMAQDIQVLINQSR